MLSLLRQWFERAWSYSGTLAALALMLGTLGMGIYHLIRHDLEPAHVKYFHGMRDSIGAEPPRGLDPLEEGETSGIATARLCFEYGEDGLLHRMRHLNAEGLPEALPGSHVAEQRMHYDKEGRLIRKENCDAAGNPAPDASGVAEREFCYDEQGRLAGACFKDARGCAIVPRIPGYACARTTYDTQGRPLRIEYRDGKGQPIVNAVGESLIAFEYDDARRNSVRRNFINGKLADNAKGYAVERREHTEDGSTLRVSWENAEGKPVRNPNNSALSVLTEYSADGRIVRKCYCGEGGMPLSGSRRPVAEMLRRCSADGHSIWECYNAADGLPCINPALGYAERVATYNSAEQLERETFWDEKGNPAPCCEKLYVRDDDGEHVVSHYTDGTTTYSPVGE